MIVRALTIVFASAALLASAVMFEAAGMTSSAMALIESARTNDHPVVRTQLLERAERMVDDSWARPALWHAGAAEALSASLWLQGDGDPRKLSTSRDWAERAVALSPVLPHAWLRLALLDELGLPNSRCARTACLDRSWQTAPILAPDAECVRLAASYRAGVLQANDARLAGFVRRTAHRTAAQCLATFLPELASFEILFHNRRDPL